MPGIKDFIFNPDDEKRQGLREFLEQLFAPDPRSQEGRGFTRTETGLQFPLGDRGRTRFSDLEDEIQKGIERRKRFPIRSTVSQEFNPIPPVER